MNAVRGFPATLNLTVEVAGNLTDLDAPPTIQILDPSNTPAGTGTGTHDGTGRYHYDVTPPTNGPVGLWTIVWSGTVAGVPKSTVDTFVVVAAPAPAALGIASPSDVAGYLGRTFGPQETMAVRSILATYQDELEAILGRGLQSEPYTETFDIEVPVLSEDPALLDPDATFPSLILPVSHLPVTSIASVTSDGTPIDLTYVEPTPNGIGLIGGWLPYGTLTGFWTRVVATYTAGILNPAKTRAAKGVIVARAARYMNRYRDDMIGVGKVSTEGYTADYDADAFSESELIAVTRLKRRTVV